MQGDYRKREKGKGKREGGKGKRGSGKDYVRGLDDRRRLGRSEDIWVSFNDDTSVVSNV
jgi:hypothetical protein